MPKIEYLRNLKLSFVRRPRDPTPAKAEQSDAAKSGSAARRSDSGGSNVWVLERYRWVKVIVLYPIIIILLPSNFACFICKYLNYFN